MIPALGIAIMERFKLVLAQEPSADYFAGYVTALRERLKKEGADPTGLPLFGAHVNPDWSYIAPHQFMATLGYDGPKLVTTNTARLYEFETPKTLRWLLESCRLWYDEPELHAPLMRCTVTSDDPRMDKEVSAVVHVGSAWIHPSMRGKGLGSAMVAYHRLKAMEALGEHLMFGTTNAVHSGSFTGTERHQGVAEVCMFAPGDPNGIPEVQQVRLWTKPDLIAAAERITTPSQEACGEGAERLTT
jgi:hypothetical protein